MYNGPAVSAITSDRIPHFVRAKLGDDSILVWAAGMVMQRHYEKRPANDLKGKTVVELGSGSGLLACAVARLGAHVTATDM